MLTEDQLQEILNRAADQVSGTPIYMDIITLVDEYRQENKLMEAIVKYRYVNLSMYQNKDTGKFEWVMNNGGCGCCSNDIEITRSESPRETIRKAYKGHII
jgi:hypothetical protein